MSPRAPVTDPTAAPVAAVRVPAQVHDILRRKLIFVSGKGGVGKTLVSKAVAQTLARAGRRVLWVTFEDPLLPPGELKQIEPGYWQLNAEAGDAFEEYAGLRIGSSGLTRLFLKNKVVRYLAKVAPGIHELVLLGKLWYEQRNYDTVIADMPSTGYGLAMFQSTANFADLFRGSPIQKDADKMLATFNDPATCGQLIVALPEEMPLRESLELEDFLLKLFPANPPAFLVNRCFPTTGAREAPPAFAEDPSSPETAAPAATAWRNPLAESAEDYAEKRGILENYNLRIWRSRGVPFGRLNTVLPAPETQSETAWRVSQLAEQLRQAGYV